MRESLDLPTIPEYVSIKEAAKMLGVSDKRVYAYIEEGRLPAVRAAHVIMIPVEAVRRFKPNISGRPRKHTPSWRTSLEENMLVTVSVLVEVKMPQQELVQQRLEELKQTGDYTFPGTIARYIIQHQDRPGYIELLLIWRRSSMPDTQQQEQALEAFRVSTRDVLDWSTARYSDGTVLMHT